MTSHSPKRTGTFVASTTKSHNQPPNNQKDLPFTFPREHTFPPFYTRQPIPQTNHAQLSKWSSLILSYCAHTKTYQLPLQPTHLLFMHPTTPSLHLTLPHLREIFDHMRLSKSIDYIPPSGSNYASATSGIGGSGGALSSSGGGGGGAGAGLYPSTMSNTQIPEGEKVAVVVYWKSLEEWGEGIWNWVDETGQKGSVLTVYELVEGGGGVEWEGMDEVFLKRVLHGLVKRGKAALFSAGGDGALGVKFF